MKNNTEIRGLRYVIIGKEYEINIFTVRKLIHRSSSFLSSTTFVALQCFAQSRTGTCTPENTPTWKSRDVLLQCWNGRTPVHPFVFRTILTNVLWSHSTTKDYTLTYAPLRFPCYIMSIGRRIRARYNWQSYGTVYMSTLWDDGMSAGILWQHLANISVTPIHHRTWCV